MIDEKRQVLARQLLVDYKSEDLLYFCHRTLTLKLELPSRRVPAVGLDFQVQWIRVLLDLTQPRQQAYPVPTTPM